MQHRNQSIEEMMRVCILKEVYIKTKSYVCLQGEYLKYYPYNSLNF